MKPREYSVEETEAALSVLAELLTHLGAYREGIVVVGGFGPYLLLRGQQAGDPHIGTLDVDLALDPARIADPGYEAILDILEKRGFIPARDRRGQPIPHRFVRTFQDARGREHTIPVDFLAPEYGGTGPARRHQRIQSLLAHKARGADLVFEQFLWVEVEAFLPNGARQKVRAKVANGAACVVMKAITLVERGKEKDAYDLYMLAKHYPGGRSRLAQEVLGIRSHGLVREALRALHDKFGEVDALGPLAVADFLGERDADARAIRARDACEIIQDLLAQVERPED